MAFLRCNDLLLLGFTLKSESLLERVKQDLPHDAATEGDGCEIEYKEGKNDFFLGKNSFELKSQRLDFI